MQFINGLNNSRIEYRLRSERIESSCTAVERATELESVGNLVKKIKKNQKFIIIQDIIRIKITIIYTKIKINLIEMTSIKNPQLKIPQKEITIVNRLHVINVEIKCLPQINAVSRIKNGKCAKSVKLERIKDIYNGRAKVVHINRIIPFQNDKFLSMVCI